MNNNIDDEPLFPSDSNAEQNTQYSVSNKETFNREKEDSRRKNKILEFCFSSAKWVAVLWVVMIVLDIIVQKVGLDNTILKDATSLLSYIVTAALGFMFASNNK